MFDPTLSEDVAATVRAIKGVTFHPYGLGAFDGEVCHLAPVYQRAAVCIPALG